MTFKSETGKVTTISKLNICFCGAGSMAEALVRGLITKNLMKPQQISMLNRKNMVRLRELHGRYGIQTIGQGLDHDELLKNADVVLLAVKPTDSVDTIESMKHLFNPRQLIISVIAGLSIETINHLIGMSMPIVRTMPNTSATIGLGVTAISYSNAVSEEQRLVAEQLFGAVGITEVINEELQNAATGVFGSGPAYAYYLMEAMIAGASKLGFDSDASLRLVVQTILGAAEMVRITSEHPAELRSNTTSPNGTTQAAIDLLEQFSLKETITKAIVKAAERSGEMGKELEMKIN